MEIVTQDSSVVAVYPTHEAAENAVKALHTAGVDMRHLSIVGRGNSTEEHAVGFYTSGDRMTMWGGTGAFWGSLGGVLLGGALFWIPVVGPLAVLGPLAATILGGLEGAALGGAAGVLAGALASSGISDTSVVEYETEIRGGSFLVMARGPVDLVEAARRVLGETGPSSLKVHSLHTNGDSLRATLVRRQAILDLLSDDEVASVCMAETGAHFAEGDEFVDLGRLDQGVQTANGHAVVMAHVLPRASVREATWVGVVAALKPATPLVAGV